MDMTFRVIPRLELSRKSARLTFLLGPVLNAFVNAKHLSNAGCEMVDPIRVQPLPMKRDLVLLLLRLKRDVFRDFWASDLA